jgi:uncharacterized protein (DUF488 family)
VAGPEIYTVGHSTHEESRFLRLLRTHAIELVADIRRHPGSRRHPQFGADALEGSLAAAGIGYLWLGEELGGRRRSRPGSPNSGWRVEGFRGYADHMGGEEFQRGLGRLEEAAGGRRTAVMCAEGDWRRCHRQLVADALVVRGWRVLHIGPRGELEEHRLTPFAVAGDGGLRYPPPQEPLQA